MNRKIVIPKEIITVNSAMEIHRNSFIEIEDGIIIRIDSLKSIELNNYEGEVYKYPNLTLMPGFVQTHIHLCQTLFRGLADDMQLLDWLQKRIFPYENNHNKESLRISAKLGISELFMSGTTTLLDMGTMHHQEVVFEEMIKSGIRGFSGKCMIDENDLFPTFKESTEASLNSTIDLAKSFHNSENGRIKYGFAPRFVLSCSEGLMKETSNIMNDFDGSLYHTHSSENKGEIEAVRKKYGKENIEYFNSINVLSEKTILAHAIHINDKEVELLKTSGTRVAHCPSSNMKLGSGIAEIPRYINEGISVSIGADGAPCNNNLNMFTEMRIASLIQKPIYNPTVMDAELMVRLATIEGAKALHLSKEIGSIEVGKKADLQLLNLEKANHSMLDDDENLYSSIVYAADKSDVTSVMVEGEWVVRNGVNLVYDESEMITNGRAELTKLLNRAKID
ncbi:MAG: amidohydrolase family protein [Melioribacteraceae bacterium]|nr:amidohydrolase family protein [Melioribacteraceae bacterium]